MRERERRKPKKLSVREESERVCKSNTQRRGRDRKRKAISVNMETR